MKLVMNYKKITGKKKPNTWRLNNMLLITKESTKKSNKY